jgi:hypothetical protein
LSVVTNGDAGRRTPLAEAVQMLDNAAETRQVCLGAEGFWLVEGGVEPSRDHILDLSEVEPRNPHTNASIAKATIEHWPDDPSRFAVELEMVRSPTPAHAADTSPSMSRPVPTRSAPLVSGRTTLSSCGGQLCRVARTDRA